MRYLAIFLFAGALAAPAAGAAQSSRLDAEYRARGIERNTLSPFCPGRTLYDCPSPRAAAWRSDIRRWVGEGWSDVEIRRALEARAPDMDLAGSGLGDWTVFALFLLSLAVLGLFTAGQLRSPAPTAHEDAVEPGDPALEARLDDELRSFDST